MVLKGLACLMTVSGSVGLGIWYRNQLSMRLRALQSLIRITELFSGEIRFQRKALPECCNSLKTQLEKPYSQWFEEIHKQCRDNPGENFSEIMSNCLDDGISRLPVTEEEKRIFLGFIPKEAYYDRESQLTALEKCRQALQTRIRELETECKQKGKLAISLGVGAGLMLVIVFV